VINVYVRVKTVNVKCDKCIRDVKTVNVKCDKCIKNLIDIKYIIYL